MNSIKIVAVPGSLREASLTKKLLFSLQALAPDDVEIKVFELDDIPIYNKDVEDAGYPASVMALRQAIAEADGIIFATPEYNGSFTGAIKNAVDWASRGGLLAGRPVAPLSGSPGALGATKAQQSLRLVLEHLGMYVLTRPQIAVPHLDEKLDGNRIADEQTAEFLSTWLTIFRDWIVQLNK